MAQMWADVRTGMRAVAPMLVGVVPFGLVAGASPVAKGLSGWAAVGFSTIVFAGASQLAAIDVLADGGSAVVAVLAACTINLRMLLYSASLAPHLAHERLGRRLVAAYLLTDQAYAVSIDQCSKGQAPERRLPYYFGAGLTLWASWQAATLVGVAVGGSLPDDLPLGFAIPLCFLVLLVPTFASPPAIVAALAGGAAAVVTAEVGGGDLSILVGAVTGIAAGAIAEVALDRRTPPPVVVGE
ncbi:MAG: AzlC family protein [Actinomycetia bacterium]|nr:AzlC family protein [Actinomycetes bacterium]